MKAHLYHTYILTNPTRTSFYTGVTNDIRARLTKHREAAEVHNSDTFTGRYNCIHLVYVESFQWIQDAIAREKQLKGWTRQRKLDLIRSLNPEMRFLEDDLTWQ
jgi:putative endonuclease